MAIDFQKILSTVGGIVHKGAGIANKVAGLLKDPIGSAMKAISPFVTKVANKLPFGLGKTVGPFVQKFLGQGLNWLAKGPLAGVMSLFKKIQPTAQKLAGFVGSLDKLLAGGFKNLLAPAKANAQKAIAYAQAQGILGAEKAKPAAKKESAAANPTDGFEAAPAAKTETPASAPDLAAPENLPEAETAAAEQQTETPVETAKASDAKSDSADAVKKEEEEEEFVPLTDEQLEAEIAQYAPEREKISADQIDAEYKEAFGG
jgi:hypothetical protein